MWKKTNLIVLVIVVVITGFFLAQDYIFTKADDKVMGNTPEDSNQDNSEIGINVGQIAPNFVLNDLNGGSHELKDFRGSTVMLNFWSTTCPPCLEEMPYMQDVYTEFKSHGFEIIAVNLDPNMKEVKSFIEHFGYDFLVLEGDAEIARSYMVRFIPKSLFIDPNGVIHSVHVGALDYDEMVDIVKEISSN